MILKPMDVLAQFPVRKGWRQKKAFRAAVSEYAQGLGWDVKEEKGSLGARNIIIGDPASAKYLITAHYDTPAGMLVPNFITPCNFWAYMAYQILIVAGFFFIAFAAGVFAAFVIADYVAFVVYAVYFGMLLLMLFGPANRNNSNDNTSGVVTVLAIANDLPQEFRKRVCFVLFDLEEAGLIGSASYRSNHKKETQNQLVLNLDCVGDGDHIMLFPGRRVKKREAQMHLLRSQCGTYGEKTVSVREKGFAMYPSDQSNFPFGVGICALRKGKCIGYYLGRIHTRRDTILEEENVKLLSDLLTCVVQADS